MARCVGLKRDLRLSKLETYSNYYYLNFRSYTGQRGDSYDRFLIRMNEMSESLNIINQVIQKITKYTKTSKNQQNNFSKKNSNINAFYLYDYLNKKNYLGSNTKNEYTSMEHLIKHFKY